MGETKASVHCLCCSVSINRHCDPLVNVKFLSSFSIPSFFLTFFIPSFVVFPSFLFAFILYFFPFFFLPSFLSFSLSFFSLFISFIYLFIYLFFSLNQMSQPPYTGSLTTSSQIKNPFYPVPCPRLIANQLLT